jgi:uncharacterized protein (DUF3084 family)
MKNFLVNKKMEEKDDNENDDELYGDLAVLTRNIEIEKLSALLAEKDQTIANLQAEMEQLKTHFLTLYNEKKTMEKNTVSIYNTALRELQRKDKELNEMKEQLKKFGVKG